MKPTLKLLGLAAFIVLTNAATVLLLTGGPADGSGDPPVETPPESNLRYAPIAGLRSKEG